MFIIVFSFLVGFHKTADISAKVHVNAVRGTVCDAQKMDSLHILQQHADIPVAFTKNKIHTISVFEYQFVLKH